ncbi:MAG: hypothetical protein J6P76_02495 [Acidaminococcaceae bacterium]|nr:hypothetical protein [Acidaminococcaceae bacterium]MBP5736766.1 hypothetical protein [Acidaminococcaceae bacterium]
MLDLSKEFSLSGFLEETEEDGTILYVMDFPDDVYITVTDDNGRTPVRAKQNLVLACYDREGRYLWGSEFKTFMELQKLCQNNPAGSAELLQALKDASKTLKEKE